MKKKGLIMAICVALMLVLGLAAGVWASPDTINLTGISTTPHSTQNGSGKNYVLDVSVNAGDPINLNFTVAATGTGGSTYPEHITITPSTVLGSTVTVTGLVTATLNSVSGSVAESATLTAPATEGNYQVKFTADGDVTGANHINGDSFIINFVVTVPTCTAEKTWLILNTPPCVVVHDSNNVSLSATLKSGATTPGDTPLADEAIDFYVDGNQVGTATTNTSGVAILAYDASSLSVGDHTLSAAWTSDDPCLLDPTVTGATLGVQYLFRGFQSPINADGSTVLTGKCGPVKIIILDANGVPVPNATAYVYFADGIQKIVGTDPSNDTVGLNFDAGNVMRYSDGQYVYNWDLSSVTNGTKTICVDLGEGSCAGKHLVVVSVGKKK
jgi:hypothetical protein